MPTPNGLRMAAAALTLAAGTPAFAQTEAPATAGGSAIVLVASAAAMLLAGTFVFLLMRRRRQAGSEQYPDPVTYERARTLRRPPRPGGRRFAFTLPPNATAPHPTRRSTPLHARRRGAADSGPTGIDWCP